MMRSDDTSSSSSSSSLESFAKNLDYMSKHCIYLLQNHHNFTLTAQNSITTEYGNVVLQKLLQLLPTNTTTSSSSSSSNRTSNTETSTIIALRAYMILQNMEFTDGTIMMIPPGHNQILPPGGSHSHTSPIIRRQRQNHHHHLNEQLPSNHGINDSQSNDNDDLMMKNSDHNHSSSSNNNTINTNTTTMASSHRHRLPRTIPKPNRETYNTILLLLSRTSGSYTIPQMAQTIVEQMEYRYNVLHELDVKVTNFHYNCILLAWSLCTEYDKCLHATQLLIYNATRSHSHEIVDGSSYIHVLRICANHVKFVATEPSTHATDRTSTTTTTVTNTMTHRITSYLSNPSPSQSPPQQLQSQLLGANVAIQLWKEMFERNTTTTTMAYGATTGGVSGYDNNNNNGSGTLLDARNDTSLKALLTQYLSDDERQTVPLYIPDLPPHFYSHFLQAIRPLPIVYPSQYSYNNNDNYDPRTPHKRNNISNHSNNYSIRDLYYMKCMDHAIENGKVNSFVLQEFFVHVKNKYIFDMFLGDYRSQIFGMHPNEAVPHLMNACLPRSWYRNIQTSTYNNSNSNANSNNNNNNNNNIG